MNNLIKVINDRRKIQNAYNKKNDIIPMTIKKSDDQIIISTMVADSILDSNEQNKIQYDVNSLSELDRENILIEMRKDMLLAAETMEFEKAAKIRDSRKPGFSRHGKTRRIGAPVTPNPRKNT